MRTPEEIAEALYAQRDDEAAQRERKANANTLILDKSTKEGFIAAFESAMSASRRSTYVIRPIVLESQLTLVIYGPDGEDEQRYVIPRGAQYARYAKVGGRSPQIELWWDEGDSSRRLLFERSGNTYTCVGRRGFNQERSGLGRSARVHSSSTHILRLG